jgi:2-methylcitrate dehydratase
VESVEKFDALVAGRVDAGLSREIKGAVLSLESIQVRDLVNLLSHAKASSEGPMMRASTYPTRKAQ